MTEDQVRKKLRKAAGTGAQVTAFAARAGVSVPLVYMVMRGGSPPRDAILDALGIEHVVTHTYRPKATKATGSTP